MRPPPEAPPPDAAYRTGLYNPPNRAQGVTSLGVPRLFGVTRGKRWTIGHGQLNVTYPAPRNAGYGPGNRNGWRPDRDDYKLSVRDLLKTMPRFGENTEQLRWSEYLTTFTNKMQDNEIAPHLWGRLLAKCLKCCLPG